MKKLLLLLVIVFLVAGPVRAQGVKLCPTESGCLTFYNFTTHSFFVGVRYPLVDYKGLAYLDCMTRTDFSSFYGGLGISLDVVKIWREIGLNVHLKESVNVGFLIAHNADTWKWDYGPYVGVKIDW